MFIMYNLKIQVHLSIDAVYYNSLSTHYSYGSHLGTKSNIIQMTIIQVQMNLKKLRFKKKQKKFLFYDSSSDEPNN